MNLADALAVSASNLPDRTAIVFRDQHLTFRELDDEVHNVAAGLLTLGVMPGDRVALWLPNHPRFLVAMYAVWRIGAVVVPVHAMLTRSEAEHILSDAQVKILICAEPKYSTAVAELRGHLSGLQHVVVLGGDASDSDMTFDSLAQSRPEVALEPHTDSASLALIAYTSGTSGLPKGAMLTHANLQANLDQMRQIPIAPQPTDVVLCILPLFHIFGLNVVANLSVATGAQLLIMERFDAADCLRMIREKGVTQIAAAPPVFVAWLHHADLAKDAFGSVTVAVSGAAPLPKEVLEHFRDSFGITIWEGYGMTEASPTLTSTSIGGVAKPGSIGRPLPDVEIRIVAPDGEDAEEGDPGELFVRGPNIFSGYWGHPEYTEAAFVGGWFKTGDVVIEDPDGDLYIVDRKRDLILVSGFNVYPKEVEDVLAAHPRISECAVVGISDPYQGEAVKAFVVPNEGAEVTADEVTEFASTNLAPYKIPSVVEFVGQIPRNAAGKVLRRSLR